jgi:hypothetical protein
MRLVHKLLIIFILLYTKGCVNPFNPEINEGIEIGHGRPNISPYNVLRNLEAAYNQMNLDLYISTLDKDFHFSANDDVIPQLGKNWWGYDVEIEFHRNLFSRGSTNRHFPVPNMILLNLTIPPDTDWFDDNEVGHENWVVIRCGFYLRLSFTAHEDMVASGFARFHMKPVDGQWYIGKWVDESN